MRRYPNLKEGEVSIPQIDVDQSGKKKYKLLMVTNRIEEAHCGLLQRLYQDQKPCFERKTNSSDWQMVGRKNQGNLYQNQR